MNLSLSSRWLWGALGVFIGLATTGCAVPQCERGAVGCVDGPVREDGNCALDLVPQGGLCVRERDLLTGDAAAALPDVCGRCDDGLICASDTKKCLDFCAAEDEPPAPVAPPDRILCGGEPQADGEGVSALSFEQTCRNTCELDCRRWKDLCDAPCEPGACDKADVLEKCHERCDDSDPLASLACIQSICSDARARGCMQGAPDLCPPGQSADCDSVLCANTCLGAVFDGVCDDGDPASAQTASCAFGTDCADCGPRKSTNEPSSEQERTQGTSCSFHEQCAGFSQDFADNESFCAPVSKTEAGKRCLRDCSGDEESCPFGAACTTLKSSDDGKVLEDQAGRKARACVPMCD